jgi:hypothetical protein
LSSLALRKDAIFLCRVDAGVQLQREQGVLVRRTLDLETQFQLSLLYTDVPDWYICI